MPSPRYSALSIILHWLVAALIVLAFPVGLIMVDLPVSPTRLKLFAYHKWLGITILWLVSIRLAWRQFSPAPALPVYLPAWQKRLSQVVQALLYILMFAVPISGWMYSSAAGYSVIYLNWIQLPDLVQKDKALADSLKEIHETLNWTMLALVALHVLAALKHRFIDRDDILSRMSPFGGKSA